MTHSQRLTLQQLASSCVLALLAGSAAAQSGYGMPGKASRNRDMPALAGMGALRSSTTDLLKFVGANAGLIPSPLYPAMQATHKRQHPPGKQAGEFIGLGWHVLDKFGSRIVWHNGGTAGYRTYIGFDPDTRRERRPITSGPLAPAPPASRAAPPSSGTPHTRPAAGRRTPAP